MSETKGSFSHTLVHHSRSASKQSRNFILTCAKLPEVGVNLLQPALAFATLEKQLMVSPEAILFLLQNAPNCTSEHSYFQKFSGEACPQTPLGRAANARAARPP